MLVSFVNCLSRLLDADEYFNFEKPTHLPEADGETFVSSPFPFFPFGWALNNLSSAVR